MMQTNKIEQQPCSPNPIVDVGGGVTISGKEVEELDSLGKASPNWLKGSGEVRGVNP